MPALKIGFNVTFEEAIEAAKTRGVVLPDIYYNILPPECRRLAFSVSLLASLQQIQGVLDQLTDHLAQGKTFDEFKTWGEQQDWSLPPGRLQTIFRNGVQTAYNAGHWRQFEQGALVRPWLMYDAINDTRTRPAHAAMDGYIRKVHDPFWDHHSPPCGHNCRCSIIALTDAEADRRSPPGKGRLKPESDDARPDDAGWGRRPDKKRDQTYRDLIDQHLVKKTKPKAKTEKIPKAAEQKKQEPERPWDPTKPCGIWHEHAFTGAPKEVMSALKRWPETPHGLKQTAGQRGAYWDPYDRFIEMGDVRTPWTLNGQSVFRHEYGHHLDWRLKKQTAHDFRSQSPDFTAAMEADAKRIIKVATRPLNDMQRPDTLTSTWKSQWDKNRDAHLDKQHEVAQKNPGARHTESYTEGQRKLLKKLGFDYDELLDAMDKHGHKPGAALDLHWNMDHLIAALERRDPTAFMRYFMGDPGAVERNVIYYKGCAAQMDDLAASATGTRAGHYFGHEYEYYFGVRKHYARQTECFANITDLISNDNPFFSKYLQRMFPKMLASYRKIMAEET
jgi:SPP1 gp7 family putative phage head morphogenesis protein